MFFSPGVEYKWVWKYKSRSPEDWPWYELQVILCLLYIEQKKTNGYWVEALSMSNTLRSKVFKMHGKPLTGGV